MTGGDSRVHKYWEDIFPFSPYENQAIGINTAIDTLRNGGIHVLEGPCGTGKTLIALTAGLSIVRDANTKYDRVLVITSKKQQLTAFEDDFQTINENSDTYFNGLTLVGKSDLCPYVQTGIINSSDIYHKCVNLRDNTRQLMKKAVEERRTTREVNAAFGLAVRAESDKDRLKIEDSFTPYQHTIPDVGGTEYCPFYASHITNSVQDSFPLSIDRVTSGAEILTEGSRNGTCPHIEMRRMHEDASILFGNYKHAFCPRTVAGLTGEIIDESTLLICDEAHSLVSEVRDQLSYKTSFSHLRRAIIDINEVHGWLKGKGDIRKQGLSNKIIANTDLSPSDLTTCSKFLKKIQEILSNKIMDFLERNHGNEWKLKSTHSDREEVTIPLQPPQNPKPDTISKWVSDQGYESIWKLFLKVSKVVSVTKDVISKEVDGKSPDGSFPIGELHELLNRWWNGDNTEYFREIKLNPRTRVDDNPPSNRPWRRSYYAEIRINNNIPQKEIAGTLDAFGGAMLMSATLSPLNIYEEVTGISALKEGTQPPTSLVTQARDEAVNVAEKEEENDQINMAKLNVDDIGEESPQNETRKEDRKRTVKRTVFKLGFPEENRGSFIVNAPRFTWKNRWPPRENPNLRDTYASILSSAVSTTPGNVLICMPSYKEASWATNRLNRSRQVDKKVLTDTSSSDVATEQLKEAFFEGDGKVLTTSLRGTLIEGVDFDGDKLSAVVVCGVPITNTSSPEAKAIENAYDSRFNYRGFEYAFTIPAIRKTRQALGRVIRGDTDVGVRILVDERYMSTQSKFGGTKEYFPDHEIEEYVPVSPSDLQLELELFWQ